MKIKKDDTVLVISGKDRGKTGKVEKALPRLRKIVIPGINIRKKHLKPSKKHPKGGVMEFPAPFNISNVKLICPKCNKPTRLSLGNAKDQKGRKCKKCQEVI